MYNDLLWTVMCYCSVLGDNTLFLSKFARMQAATAPSSSDLGKKFFTDSELLGDIGWDHSCTSNAILYIFLFRKESDKIWGVLLWNAPFLISRNFFLKFVLFLFPLGCLDCKSTSAFICNRGPWTGWEIHREVTAAGIQTPLLLRSVICIFVSFLTVVHQQL